MKYFIAMLITSTSIISASSVIASDHNSVKAQYKSDKENCRQLVNQRKQSLKDKHARYAVAKHDIKTAPEKSVNYETTKKINNSGEAIPERLLDKADIRDNGNDFTNAIDSVKQVSLKKTKESFPYKLVSECMKDKGHT